MLVADKTIMTFAKRLFEEVYVKGQVEKLDEFFTPDAVISGLMAPFTPDLTGLKQMSGMLLKAFTNQTWEVQEIIVEGDRVALRLLTSSNHTGEFAGIPPTGKKVTITGLDLWHMRDGKIAEKWLSMDMLGLMVQLGALGK